MPRVLRITLHLQRHSQNFCLQFGGHHRVEQFQRQGELPPNELQIYTWPDATLRELTGLIKSAQPAARRSNARLEFALVYPDKKGRNVMRQVQCLCVQDCLDLIGAFLDSGTHGAVQIGVTHSTRVGDDDTKTLKQLQFQVPF